MRVKDVVHIVEDVRYTRVDDLSREDAIALQRVVSHERHAMKRAMRRAYDDLNEGRPAPDPSWFDDAQAVLEQKKRLEVRILDRLTELNRVFKALGRRRYTAQHVYFLHAFREEARRFLSAEVFQKIVEAAGVLSETEEMPCDACGGTVLRSGRDCESEHGH